MSRVHDPARSEDPVIRAAVDAALADASSALRLCGVVDRLAEALRADHPDDWETRLPEVWQLLTSPQEAAGTPALSSDRVAALAALQGVRPVSSLADLVSRVWPEDETADEFQEAVQAWRRGA
jgi:hypothetical protein